ncbi:MAG: hypothetical protein ABIT05_03800 [Chitinophagaceae bacterium]
MNQFFTTVVCGFLFIFIGTYNRFYPKNITGSFPKQVTMNLRVTERFLRYADKPAEPYLGINIEIINTSDSIASFYEDWNLWGHFNVSFKVYTQDSVYLIYRKMKDFDKNFPSYVVLDIGDTLKLGYSLFYKSSGDFINLPQNKPIKSIQAFYQLDSCLHKETCETTPPDSVWQWYGKMKKNLNYKPDPNRNLQIGPRRRKDSDYEYIRDTSFTSAQVMRSFVLDELCSNKHFFQ